MMSLLTRAYSLPYGSAYWKHEQVGTPALISARIHLGCQTGQSPGLLVIIISPPRAQILVKQLNVNFWAGSVLAVHLDRSIVGCTRCFALLPFPRRIHEPNVAEKLRRVCREWGSRLFSCHQCHADVAGDQRTLNKCSS